MYVEAYVRADRRIFFACICMRKSSTWTDHGEYFRKTERVEPKEKAEEEFREVCACVSVCSKLSNFTMNPLAVNSAVISFLENLLDFGNKRPENVCLFFDLAYFLVFQRILNTTPQARCDPRFSWIVQFVEAIVEEFFFLWAGRGARDSSSAWATGDVAQEGPSSSSSTLLQAPNAFLPIELLFSKKKSSHMARGGGVLDFFSPTSDGSLLSVHSNYEEGSDARVLKHMRKQVLEKGFSSPIDAVADCRREVEEELGYLGGQAGRGGSATTKFDKHEDEMLLKEYLIYRDVSPPDTKDPHSTHVSAFTCSRGQLLLPLSRCRMILTKTHRTKEIDR